MTNLKKIVPIETQYSPFSPFQRELNRIFRDFRGWFEPFGLPLERVERFENFNIMPAMDITDEKDRFRIELEMPGMEKENVKISISDGLLTIKGEKTVSKEDKDKNYVMREINYGGYERSIGLPNSADVDKAKASFKNGMLLVDVPKKPESVKKHRVLEIETS